MLPQGMASLVSMRLPSAENQAWSVGGIPAQLHAQASRQMPGQASDLDLTVSLTSSAGATPTISTVTFSAAEDIPDGGAVQASVPATAAVGQQYESTAQLQQMSNQVQ